MSNTIVSDLEITKSRVDVVILDNNIEPDSIILSLAKGYTVDNITSVVNVIASDFMDDISSLRTKLSDMTTTNNELEHTNDSLRHRIEELENVNAPSIDNTLRDMEVMVSQHDAEVNRLEQEIARLKTELNSGSEMSKSLAALRVELKKEMSEIRHRLTITSGKRKLTCSEVKTIRRMGKTKTDQNTIAKKFGVDKSTVSRILNMTTYTDC